MRPPTSQNHAYFVSILRMCGFLYLFNSCDLGGDLDGNSDDHLWAHVKSKRFIRTWPHSRVCVSASAKRVILSVARCIDARMCESIRRWLCVDVYAKCMCFIRFNRWHCHCCPFLHLIAMREEKTSRNELTAKTVRTAAADGVDNENLWVALICVDTNFNLRCTQRNQKSLLSALCAWTVNRASQRPTHRNE